MANKTETLLFLVDIQVRNAKALRALDAELDAVAAAHERRLLALKQAIAPGNGTAVAPLPTGNGGNGGTTVIAGNGGNGGGQPTFWGVRGPHRIGSKENPMVQVQESGEAAGLGSLASALGDARKGEQPTVKAVPAPAPDGSSEPLRSFMDALAAQRRLQQALAGPSTVEMLTAAAAARQLGVSRTKVYDLLGSGALAGEKTGGQWQVPADAVAAMVAANAGGGGGGGGAPPVVLGGGGNPGFWRRLLWGKSRFGLAGMGTVGAFAGLSLDHVIFTALGLAGSAAGAAAGAGLLGLGALGQMGVGGGSDILASHTAAKNIHQFNTDLSNLSQAIAVYGKNSRQAAQAQAQLNYDLQSAGPAARAELAVAKDLQALSNLWANVSAGAQKQASSIFAQVVDLAQRFAPLVAQAAQRNLSIINKDLKPLFEWLQGPQGVGIFKDLENHFAQNLPHAVHAFDQAIELLLRTIDDPQIQNALGGFTRWADRFFTRFNGADWERWHREIGRLVNDFRIWEAFIKALLRDIFDLFRADAGTGNSIVQSLTQMLDKFGQWERSTRGQTRLRSIFEVHKQEILALLELIPGFVKAFGSLYLAISPPLVMVVSGLAKALETVVNALEGLGPAGSWVIGLTVLGAKFGALQKAVSGLIASLMKSGLGQFLARIPIIGNMLAGSGAGGGNISGVRGPIAPGSAANPIAVTGIGGSGVPGGAPGAPGEKTGFAKFLEELGVTGGGGAAAAYTAPILLAGLLSSRTSAQQAQQAAGGLAPFMPPAQLQQFMDELKGLTGTGKLGNLPWGPDSVALIKQADAALKSFASTGNAQALQAVIDKARALKKEWPQNAQLFDQLLKVMDQARSHTLPGLASAAQQSFVRFARSVGAAIASSAVSTSQGMRLIAQATDQLLKAFGATQIPIPQLIHAQQLTSLFSQGQTGVAGVLTGAATGALIQFGDAGARGRDGIPVNFGGVPIMVGSGEVGAVFTHQQQAALDEILAPLGGLGGFFQTFKSPHYMATGGMLRAPRVSGAGALATLVRAALGYGTNAANAFLGAHSALPGGPPGGAHHGGATSAGGPYNSASLAALWVAAGGPPGVAHLMASIALAESGGNPNAYNPSGASGLWQILGVPFPGNPFDPATNARMAVAKYLSQGLGAWVTYTSGAYKTYYARGGIIGRLLRMAAGGGPIPSGGWAQPLSWHPGGSSWLSNAAISSSLTGIGNQFQGYQTGFGNLGSLLSILQGLQPGTSLSSIGLGSAASLKAAGLTRKQALGLIGGGPGSFNVLQQIDQSEISKYQAEDAKLRQLYRDALHNHNKKLQKTILDQLQGVDAALAQVVSDKQQAFLSEIQAKAQGFSDTASAIGDTLTGLQGIENLAPGTSLAGLGLSPGILATLGLSGAQGLVGTGLSYFQNLAQSQGGTLTAAQLAQAKAGVAAQNSLLQQQETPIENELAYYQSVLPSLSGSNRTSTIAAMQQLVQTLLGLQSSVDQNNQSLQSLTTATNANTNATGALTGTVAYVFNGQSYTASQSSDTTVNLNVGG